MDAKPSAPSPVLSHPLNLILIGSAVVSAALTMSPLPLAVGVAAELVWWVYGTRTARRQRLAATVTRVGDDEQTLVRTLSEPLRRRYLELGMVRRDLRRLADANPGLEDVGIERELAKVDELLAGWLRLAAHTAHQRAIVDGTDLVALEAAAAKDPERSDRLDAARAALAAVEASEAELLRVEDALVGLRDRVMSLPSADSLAEPLDALLEGMNAAERSSRALAALEPGGRARWMSGQPQA